MQTARSSHGDPRLTGEGGRKVWPWLCFAAFAILGLLLVFPGGVMLGLSMGFPPESTPFGLYLLIGLITNLAIGSALWLFRMRKHARSVWSPVAVVLFVEAGRNVAGLIP